MYCNGICLNCIEVYLLIFQYYVIKRFRACLIVGKKIQALNWAHKDLVDPHAPPNPFRDWYHNPWLHFFVQLSKPLENPRWKQHNITSHHKIVYLELTLHMNTQRHKMWTSTSRFNIIHQDSQSNNLDIV